MDLHGRKVSTPKANTTVSRGLTVSFGAWEDFLKQNFLSHYSESAISWIGTVQGFHMVFVGVAIGPVFDLGYVRLLIVVRMMLNALRFLMTGFAQQYYSTFLSLGVLVGLGGACLSTPGVAIVAQYFTTKRSTATGIASAGGSVGMLFQCGIAWLLDYILTTWYRRLTFAYCIP